MTESDQFPIHTYHSPSLPVGYFDFSKEPYKGIKRVVGWAFNPLPGHSATECPKLSCGMVDVEGRLIMLSITGSETSDCELQGGKVRKCNVENEEVQLLSYLLFELSGSCFR
jgi:hypothetical protein